MLNSILAVQSIISDWLLDFSVVLPSLFCALFYYYFAYRRYSLERELGLKGPFKWPILGNFVAISRKGIKQFDAENYEKYGPVVPVAFGGMEQIVVSDVELAKLILIKEHKSFSDRIKINADGQLLSRGIASLRGHEWQEMRGKLTPTFTSGKMKKMMPLMLQVLRKMTAKCVELCDARVEIESKTFFENITIDISGRTMFGIEINSIDNEADEMTGKLRQLFKISFSNPFILLIVFFPSMEDLLNRWFPTGSLRKDLVDFFVNQFNEIMTQRRAAPSNKSETQKDFIDLMMQSQPAPVDADSTTSASPSEKNDDVKEEAYGAKLSDWDVLAQLLTFFLANFDNNSGAVNIIVNILANRPDVQQRIYEELQDKTNAKLSGAAPDCDGTAFSEAIDYDTLRSLVYLENVILEASRIYLLAPQTLRVATRDVTLPAPCLKTAGDAQSSVLDEPTLHIKRGTQVALSNFNIHFNSEIFPEPHEFNPDRFNVELDGERSPAQYLLAFGQGPRNCIGMRFAMMQMKLILAFLVFHFRVVPSENTPKVIKQEALMTTRMNPLNYFRLEKRENSRG